MSHDFNFTEGGYSPSAPYNFDFNPPVVIPTYNILKGTTNDFSSIWVFDNKMYVGGEGYLTVVDLSTNTVWDWYSEVHLGKAGVALSGSDVADINITR